MINIIIDYNSDNVIIEDENGIRPNKDITISITGNTKATQNLISEILNAINPKEVALRVIDEDRISTVEEW